MKKYIEFGVKILFKTTNTVKFRTLKQSFAEGPFSPYAHREMPRLRIHTKTHRGPKLSLSRDSVKT